MVCIEWNHKRAFTFLWQNNWHSCRFFICRCICSINFKIAFFASREHFTFARWIECDASEFVFARCAPKCSFHFASLSHTQCIKTLPNVQDALCLNRLGTVPPDRYDLIQRTEWIRHAQGKTVKKGVKQCTEWKSFSIALLGYSWIGCDCAVKHRITGNFKPNISLISKWIPHSKSMQVHCAFDALRKTGKQQTHVLILTLAT